MQFKAGPHITGRISQKIQGMRNIPFEARLKKQNMHSLERSRLSWDLIEVYKWNWELGIRNNGLKFEKFRFRRQMRIFFLFEVKYWLMNGSDSTMMLLVVSQ